MFTLTKQYRIYSIAHRVNKEKEKIKKLNIIKDKL